MCLILALGGVLAAPVQAEPRQPAGLKVVTWNMDWLTLHPSSPDLPPDIPRRSAHAFQALRHYARRLQGDVIVVEEVADEQAIWNVFNRDDYRLFLANDPVAQRVGLLVRRQAGLTITRHPDLSTLALSRPGAHHPLRSGLDVTLADARGHSLRLLGVHLKSGCWARPLAETGHACPVLYRQFQTLEEWILDRADSGEAFVILGDFNRQLTARDPLMARLLADAPLTLTTSGLASPCQGGRRFIDHLLLGGEARNWLVPGSLQIMVLPPAPETENPGQEETETLSDHCPVSVRLTWPLSAP
ncbi:endonuclease/exonuclease/phosphatase family protein [Oecophyllibacter saccharovorans]|uniref:endonuclease/exonuclease/phosphatase family protein n=1 Tax=Oecophyllibacter saccharovorans TaxID=2558360 RepID=UPI001F4FA0F6|nr:endonuclease/exonuclease/phosphatase family protein [Oecophyllibacter saccharovorans]